MRKRTAALVALPVVVVGAAVGIPFFYIHVIHGAQPAKLSLGSTAVVSLDPTPLDPTGSWVVGGTSQAGYRVKEILVGQSTEAVGRTSAITGGFTVAASTVTTGSFTVDLTKVTSDSGQRDNQFRNRIMNTATYPTATFALTSPAPISSVPADGQTVTVPVSGDFTLHGTTKAITVPLQIRRTGPSLEVAGDIAVHFADYGVDNPSGGPAQVGDDGTVELLLGLTKTA